MFSYCFVFVVSFLAVANAENNFKAKNLPNYITACSKSSPDLNNCAVEHGRKALPVLLKGDKKYKIPVLYPLKLDKVEIKPSDTFELILTNVTVYGLEQLNLKDISIQEPKRHIDVVLTGDGLRIVADYKISGQILVLPITGEGKSDFKFDDCNFKYSMDYNLIKNSDGKEYARIKDSKIGFKIKKAKFFLDNLFNGNKELGDNMNKVLNDSYEAVLEDLGEAISNVIDTIATTIIEAVFYSIPYEEILLP